MKLCFLILALCFLTGCPEVENPPEPPEGNEKPDERTADEAARDALKALLQKPIEDLPEGIPTYYWHIDPNSLTNNLVSLENLEGAWYGAVFDFAFDSPQKDARVYLQFRSDQSFSYGYVINSSKHKLMNLISGKYSIQDGNLYLQTAPHKEDALPGGYEGRNLSHFIAFCGGDHSWRSSLQLTIPLRQLDLNTIVLFNKDFSKAKVFLVRK